MASCACTARSVGAHKRNGITPPVAASSAPKFYTNAAGTQRSLSASSARQLARPQPSSRTSQIRSAKRQQHLVRLVRRSDTALLVSRHVNDTGIPCCRAESSRGGGFASGFLVGGALFGTLGFLFAPQVSSSGGTYTHFSTLHLPAPICGRLWYKVQCQKKNCCICFLVSRSVEQSWDKIRS